MSKEKTAPAMTETTAKQRVLNDPYPFYPSENPLAPPPRCAPIPVPRSGFASNEEEARWLEQTIIMRTAEMLRRAGVSADIRPKGLYELLLLSLDAATRRALKTQKPPPGPKEPSDGV